MSRCFPFPPPGYENKARPDGDANLLIKENHKDKKQKKDKKDKEKKERRDKDRERSSEKHRDKKERKHKHKDKKDKNRDKEGKKASEEKKIVALSDHQNSEKFGPTGVQVGETRNSRFLLELGKKVRNDDGAKDMQIVERISTTDLSLKSPGKVLEHNLSIFVEGNQKFNDKREENRIPNGKCLKVNAIGLANGFVSVLPAKDQESVERGIYQEGKVTEKQKEQKDTNKEKNSDGRGDKHKDGDREKKRRSKDKKRKKEEKEKAKEEKVELSSLMPSKSRESGNSAIDSKNDKGSYLFKERNASNGILSKRKEPEKDGYLNGSEIQNNKLPRPVSSSHQVIQIGSKIETSRSGVHFALEKEATVQKHKSNIKVSSSTSVVENGSTFEMRQTAINFAPERQDAVSNHNKANDSLSSVKSSLGDRRNLEPCQTVTSSSDMEHGLVTNHTLNKKVLSLQTVVQNGRNLESSQFNNRTAAKRQEAVSKSKFDGDSRIDDSLGPELDKRASSINGLVELKKHGASLRSPSAPGQKEIVETRMKPPHPDAKYLSEILSVPKVEWSDVDDQNWLFSSENHQAKKPKMVSTMTEESKHVWAEALQIKSADVTVLPYVIPY